MKNNYLKKLRYRGVNANELWVDVEKSPPENVKRLKTLFAIGEVPKFIKISFYANKNDQCHIKIGDVEYKFMFHYTPVESGFVLNFVVAEPFCKTFTKNSAINSMPREKLIRILLDFLI